MFNDLFEAFYKKYEKPQVDLLTVAFSGIDPQKKVIPALINHEKLGNLLGGDKSGHYHLTEEQIKKLEMIIETYPPNITPDQSVDTTADKEITPYEVQGENLRN